MEDSNNGIERRRFKRARVSLTVIYRVNEPLSARMLTADKEIQATIKDLSESGMAILTDYPIAASTILLIRFTLFKVEKEDVCFYGPVEIMGEVRYSTPLDSDLHRLGINFIKIEEQDRREIADFVKRVMEASHGSALEHGSAGTDAPPA